MKNKAMVLIVAIAVLLVVSAALIYGFKNNIFADTRSSRDSSKFTFFRTSLYGKESSEIQSINFNLPKGETESLTFEIVNKVPQSSYQNLTILTDDIRRGTSVFPQKNIDLRLINNWIQKELDLSGSGGSLINVNELLTKRNTEDYLSSDITKQAKDLPNKNGIKASSTDKDDSLKFSIAGKESVKIFLKVTAPSKSGSYMGNLRITNGDGIRKTISSIPIRINVSDKSLPQPDKKFACYVNDRIIKESSKSAVPIGMEEYYIEADLFRERLIDIHQMGCNALVLRVSKASDTAKMLEYAQEIGFDKGVLIDFRFITSENKENKWNDLSAPQPETDSLSQQQFKGVIADILSSSKLTIPIKFYGIDEPNERIAPTQNNNSNVPRYDLYKTKALNSIALYREVLGEKVLNSGPISPEVSTAMVNCTYDDLQKEPDQLLRGGEPILNYVYDPTINKIPGLENCNQSMKQYMAAYKGSANKNLNATYYFQASREQPYINRYLGGLGLELSEFNGYYLNVVYGYAAKDKDGNENNPIFSETKLGGKDKNLMLMYPASDGLIPTVQSEAIREGIMDIKYYLAYQEIKRNLNKCSGENSRLMNIYINQVEGGTDKKNNQLTIQSLKANSYDIPMQNIELLRAGLKNLFFKYDELCGASTDQPNSPVPIPSLDKSTTSRRSALPVRTPDRVRTQD